jgi:predicted 3-demethylubiquinone-9 3-methyltransferase (glyoxalase superfamily)
MPKRLQTSVTPLELCRSGWLALGYGESSGYLLPASAVSTASVNLQPNATVHSAPWSSQRRMDGNSRVSQTKGQAMAKNTICVWYDKDAEAAARFYAETFPNSKVTGVRRAPSDYPSGKQGDVLVVEFTVAGVPCIGLNGGPMFKHTEAFSFQIATDDQEETDRYWNAIVGNGGKESACGWCKDKWGISWQITPRVLTEAMAAGGAEAKRAFDAMMNMKKIDVAAIKAARRG